MSEKASGSRKRANSSDSIGKGKRKRRGYVQGRISFGTDGFFLKTGHAESFKAYKFHEDFLKFNVPTKTAIEKTTAALIVFQVSFSDVVAQSGKFMNQFVLLWSLPYDVAREMIFAAISLFRAGSRQGIGEKVFKCKDFEGQDCEVVLNSALFVTASRRYTDKLNEIFCPRNSDATSFVHKKLIAGMSAISGGFGMTSARLDRRPGPITFDDINIDARFAQNATAGLNQSLIAQSQAKRMNALELFVNCLNFIAAKAAHRERATSFNNAAEQMIKELKSRRGVEAALAAELRKKLDKAHMNKELVVAALRVCPLESTSGFYLLIEDIAAGALSHQRMDAQEAVIQALRVSRLGLIADSNEMLRYLALKVGLGGASKAACTGLGLPENTKLIAMSIRHNRTGPWRRQITADTLMKLPMETGCTTPGQKLIVFPTPSVASGMPQISRADHAKSVYTSSLKGPAYGQDEKYTMDQMNAQTISYDYQTIAAMPPWAPRAPRGEWRKVFIFEDGNGAVGGTHVHRYTGGDIDDGEGPGEHSNAVALDWKDLGNFSQTRIYLHLDYAPPAPPTEEGDNKSSSSDDE